jgi:hypothetical protein
MELVADGEGDDVFVDTQPGGNEMLWEKLRKGYSNAQSVKDSAYLIYRSDAPAGVDRWDLNTPTTFERVKMSA